MKKLLLLLSLVIVCQLSMAQAKAPQQKSNTGAATKATTANKEVAKDASKAPITKLIWHTPALQEGMAYYISLQFPKAEEKFKEAIASGDKDAYYFLGRMYQYSQVENEPAKVDSLKELQNGARFFGARNDSARYYYKMALDEGSLLGHLGMAELMVLQTEDDVKRFMQHMRTAGMQIREKAVEGDAFCNRILGSMYYTGYGQMQDMGLAFNYISRAADKKDVVSYCFLANMYLEGKGVAKDLNKAKAWLEKGVAAGDMEALYTLGLLYEEGNLGEVKTEEARKLYRQAVAKGSTMAYEQLIYINQTPDQKLTAGAVTRNPEMIKRALAAGADPNTRAVPDDFGADLKDRSALMHTVYIPMLLEDYGVVYEPQVRLQTASILLRNGAKVNEQDEEGKTALHYVVASSRVRAEYYELEQIQLLDTLLHYGANPNIQDKDGNTVLTQALQSTIGQHIGIMELEKLLNSGANPNIQNNEGKTHLMLASEINANFELILALVQAGTDVTLKDSKGKAAIDFTKHENVQNILLAAGSPPKQE